MMMMRSLARIGRSPIWVRLPVRAQLISSRRMLSGSNRNKMSDGESDFYAGDEDVVKDLERRVETFDVHNSWQDPTTPGPLVRRQTPDASEQTPQLHNPWDGRANAWQLTESVDDFLSRLPPETTPRSPTCPWILISNPYIKRVSARESMINKIPGGEDEIPETEGADLATFMTEAGKRLEQLEARFVERRLKQLHRRPGEGEEAPDSDSLSAASYEAAQDILELGKTYRVTCGKWMLFCPVYDVNDVWGVIATATANNELGIGAKVAPQDDLDRRDSRLICVYTEDYTDVDDVYRVARKLKQLGLVKNGPIYYKPDIFTYLGITSKNPWSMKASVHSYNPSSIILGKKNRRRR